MIGLVENHYFPVSESCTFFLADIVDVSFDVPWFILQLGNSLKLRFVMRMAIFFTVRGIFLLFRMKRKLIYRSNFVKLVLAESYIVVQVQTANHDVAQAGNPKFCNFQDSCPSATEVTSDPV